MNHDCPKDGSFTAEHGYKWATPPEGITESQLSRYGKTVDQAYREGMGASDYVQGVIYDGWLLSSHRLGADILLCAKVYF